MRIFVLLTLDFLTFLYLASNYERFDWVRDRVCLLELLK